VIQPLRPGGSLKPLQIATYSRLFCWKKRKISKNRPILSIGSTCNAEHARRRSAVLRKITACQGPKRVAAHQVPAFLAGAALHIAAGHFPFPRLHWHTRLTPPRDHGWKTVPENRVVSERAQTRVRSRHELG
jgi:hypothetical protein